jgi:uncharacterized protein (TIGR00369 family)
MQIPPFIKYLGIEVKRREEGTGVVTLDLAPHHLNRRGVAHGGVITAMLDSALGAAVISSIPQEWWCATTSLSTQFVEGAGGGRLTARGTVTRRGAKVAFASGEVRDARGRLMATAQGTWHLWSHRPSRRERVAPSATVVMRGTGEAIHVGKIVAVGRNYAKHVAEMGAPQDAPPVFFLKPPSALTGAGPLVLPTTAGAVHHEVELVVVIGREGKSISAKDAPHHVLGYAVGLDLTLRDLQTAAKQAGEPWSLSKGFDGSAPLSPVAPREEVGDGSGLAITLDVNGERRQEGDTSQMLCGVAEVIEQASRWMTLERGDLLFTGTPAGVGPLVAGDRVTARIATVGELEIEIEVEDES